MVGGMERRLALIFGTALAAIMLAGCASSPAVPQAPGRSLVIGRVESSEYVENLGDVMVREAPSENADRIFLSEIYEVKLKVLDVLSGADPGLRVTVKLTGHVERFPGRTLAVLIDPDLSLWGVSGLSISYWEAVESGEPVCMPADLLSDEAFKSFVAKSVVSGDDRCLKPVRG